MISPVEPQKNGWVYLIGYADAGPGDPVKIGYAKRPWDRLSSRQTGTHRDLTLLDQVPGTVEAEKALHAVLADHRVTREWFSCQEEIVHAFDAIREAILDRAEVLRAENVSLDDAALTVPCDPDLFSAEMAFTLDYYAYGRETDDWNMEEEAAAHLLEAVTTMRGERLDDVKLFAALEAA